LAWWVRLGLLPELIEPGKPQQNGRHERMHRTLKAETTRPPANSRLAQQCARIRQEFNFERPHEALDMQTPGSLYQRSSRSMPDRLAPLEYPDRFEVRYVSANDPFAVKSPNGISFSEFKGTKSGKSSPRRWRAPAGDVAASSRRAD